MSLQKSLQKLLVRELKKKKNKLEKLQKMTRVTKPIQKYARNGAGRITKKVLDIFENQIWPDIKDKNLKKF